VSLHTSFHCAPLAETVGSRFQGQLVGPL